MLDHSVGSGQHSFEARGADCYETPPEAVRVLLKVEKLPLPVWEPACGPGSIVRVLHEVGHPTFYSDLYDYGHHVSQYSFGKLDFLKFDVGRLAHIGCVVTNPPYQLAQKFVEKALELKIPKVIMLLRLAFLEGTRRSHILENAGLARVHVFRNRLPMMHRRGWDGKKASSAIPFAWFVWERGYTGPTVIDRISWERS